MRVDIKSPVPIFTMWISCQPCQTKFAAYSQVCHASASTSFCLIFLLLFSSYMVDITNPLKGEPLRCFFGAGHDHALALTHSHAIVWPYSVSASSPSPSDTFTVSIPESCRDPKGAVPLGVLLSTATGEYPGLLVLIPSTGKIIYWETVSSAASLGLSRQKQNGIQGSTPGLLSGEYATEILNGEPSGIIATFSTGRVAHITLRDPQGKPSVLVNFLEKYRGCQRWRSFWWH